MMTRDELMNMAAEKAVNELSWENIEWLFRPSNMLELLLRIDFKGMRQKIFDWATDESPDAMPHRFRRPYLAKCFEQLRLKSFIER